MGVILYPSESNLLLFAPDHLGPWRVGNYRYFDCNIPVVGTQFCESPNFLLFSDRCGRIGRGFNTRGNLELPYHGPQCILRRDKEVLLISSKLLPNLIFIGIWALLLYYCYLVCILRLVTHVYRPYQRLGDETISTNDSFGQRCT